MSTEKLSSASPGTEPGAEDTPTTPTFAMMRTLGIVSAICGMIIVGSYLVTLPAAKANRRIATERAVFKVLPEAKSINEYISLPGGVIESAKEGDLPPGAVKFYAAYDAGGKLSGIAAEGSAKGYAEAVRIMFGYKPECQCIVGIGVVSMRETPGIGDKIQVDKDFLANFESLDVKLNKELTALANKVETVRHGTKANPWQIDAITGATVTSRAVGKGINDAAQLLMPRLLPKLEKIKEKS